MKKKKKKTIDINDYQLFAEYLEENERSKKPYSLMILIDIFYMENYDSNPLLSIRHLTSGVRCDVLPPFLWSLSFYEGMDYISYIYKFKLRLSKIFIGTQRVPLKKQMSL